MTNSSNFPSIDFYFDFVSPYSYLALAQLTSWPVSVNYVPIPILKVMELVNNTPTSVTCPVKRQYVHKDLMRWAEIANVSLVFHPNRQDIDRATLLRTAIAGIRLGVGDQVIAAIFSGLWRESADLSVSGLRSLLSRANLPADDILKIAADDATADMLAQNAKDAAARGVFGAPTFFVGDEMFFGNDRLEFVRRELRLT